MKKSNKILLGLVSCVCAAFLAVGMIPLFASPSYAAGSSLFYNEEISGPDADVSFVEYEGVDFVPVDLFKEVPYIETKIDISAGTFILKNLNTQDYISALCMLDRALVNDEVVDLTVHTRNIEGKSYFYVPIAYVSEIMGLQYEVYTMPSGNKALRIFDSESVMTFEAFLRATRPDDFRGFDPPVTSPTEEGKTVRIAIEGLGESSLAIMKRLSDFHMNACIFVDHNDIEKYPEYVVAAVTCGFEIGISSADSDEIDRTNAVLYDLVKIRTHLVMGESTDPCITGVQTDINRSDYTSDGEYIAANLELEDSVIFVDGAVDSSQLILVIYNEIVEKGDVSCERFGVAYEK